MFLRPEGGEKSRGFGTRTYYGADLIRISLLNISFVLFCAIRAHVQWTLEPDSVQAYQKNQDRTIPPRRFGKMFTQSIRFMDDVRDVRDQMCAHYGASLRALFEKRAWQSHSSTL
jgi:hypothetical protein